MPYQHTHFEDVRLPYYNPEQDHTPPSAEDGLIEAGGGFYDRYGSGKSKSRLNVIPVSGVIVGEHTYWVDENGNRMVDENGNKMIMGTQEQMLRSLIEALSQRVGEKGRLWRMRLDDGVRQWKMARFLNMPTPQTFQDRVLKAHVTCEFKPTMEQWHAEEQSIVSATLTNGRWSYLLIDNPGAMITDAMVTVARTSGTITNVHFKCAPLGIDLSWAGTVGSGDTLVVDNGAESLVEDGVGVYGGLDFNAGHSARGWMPIPKGTWLLGVMVEGGNAAANLSYYVQYR